MFFSCRFCIPHQLVSEPCPYLSLMATKCDGSIFSNWKVKTEVLRNEFFQLQHDVQQVLRELQPVVATPVARKSSQSNTNRCTPKYKKIPLFDGEICKLDFINWLLDLEDIFFYWEFCDEERVWLAFNKLDGEAKEW